MKWYLRRWLQQPRNNNWLIAIMGFTSTIGWIINTYTPEEIIPFCIFFISIFMLIYSVFIYLTGHVRFSLLASIGVTGYLLLRYLGLRELYYVILLILSLVSLELSIQKR